MTVLQKLPIVTVKGKQWDFSQSPKHVQHAMLLLVQKWGADFDDRKKVQPWASHRARLLAEMHATVVEPEPDPGNGNGDGGDGGNGDGGEEGGGQGEG